ncbi:MAG: site-specific DNA-methyltransferase [Planctomycetota bacterium]|nr:site-specific DNA-methyltransferase [Planctomycetota bacterium]
MNKIFFGDNLPILRELPTGSVRLVYTDPPFNTGKTQKRTQLRTARDDTGDRTGYQGRRYSSIRLAERDFADSFDDYPAFLKPRLLELHRILTPDGSFFLHLDCREVHYAKVLLDGIFGRECFMNEIIWAYDYGARSKKKWSAKHDNILWYVKDPKNYIFNHDQMDRIPYLAPGLVSKEKASRGKTPTDVWWHTIVATKGREKTGYPTQKPLGIIRRLVRVHSRPGDTLLDCFAGSGTLGVCAVEEGRNFILIDNNPQAMEIMSRRLDFANPEISGFGALDVTTTGQRMSL